MWVQVALILVLAYAVIYLGSLRSLASARSVASAHTWDNFLGFLNIVRWGAVMVAAVMAGPALLEDKRRGALELYLARAIRARDYMAGKVLAIFSLSALAVIGPGLIYWVGAFFLFDKQPTGWEYVPLGVVGYGLMWAMLVTGLGLGLSSVARSSRAATIALAGAFVVADVVVSNLLAGVTRDENWRVLSPLAALGQQVEWLFPGSKAPFPFPAWWGLLAWVALVGIGWGLVAWKRPRLAGG
jgi:hypothetical protein